MISGAKGTSLPASLWIPDEKPKAILQIAHGMTEHMGRYAALGEYLAGFGILTAGFDLRGHGHHPGNPACASFGESGWEDSLEDMHLFYNWLSVQYQNVPYIMLGFSLGSFLLREYLERYDDPVSGAVIMGTGHQPAAVISVLMGIVKTQIKKAGFDNTTPLIRNLMFDTYNRNFRPVRSDFEWLCSDADENDAYLSDPLCRHGISSGLFWQLLASMKRTGSPHTYDGWKRDLPVLLLSGAEDPVGDRGHGVNRVITGMKRAGIHNLTAHFLPDARHDILHEESSGCAASTRGIIARWIGDIVE